MNATQRVIKRLRRSGDTPESVMRELEALEAEIRRDARAAAARSSSRKPRAADPKAERVAREAAFYEQAKRDARERARDAIGIRCEVYGDATNVRCGWNAVDPDHVLGGAMRRECERLGAEGLQMMCRMHHDLKTANSPTRAYWLAQAKAHALRIGARRLLPLVERASAKDEAKRAARQAQKETAP